MYLNIEKIVLNDEAFRGVVQLISQYQNELISFSNDLLIFGEGHKIKKVSIELHEKNYSNYVYRVNWDGSLLRFICYNELSQVFSGSENKIVIASFSFDGFAIFGLVSNQKTGESPIMQNKNIESNITELMEAIEMCLISKDINTILMINRFIDKVTIYLSGNRDNDLIAEIILTSRKIDRLSSFLDIEYSTKFSKIKSILEL